MTAGGKESWRESLDYSPEIMWSSPYKILIGSYRGNHWTISLKLCGAVRINIILGVMEGNHWTNPRFCHVEVSYYLHLKVIFSVDLEI